MEGRGNEDGEERGGGLSLSLFSLNPLSLLSRLASYQQLVGHFEIQHPVDLLAFSRQHGIQLGRLGDGAGEAVQDEADSALRRPDGLPNQADDNVVRDQGARVHRRFRLQAQGAAGGDGGAQHVARRQVAQAVLLLDDGGLGALAAAGRA